MSFLRRDELARLLQAEADITLAEALKAIDVPAGLLDIALDPEDWFVVGERLWEGGQAVAAGGAGTRSQLGVGCVTGVNEQGIVVLEGGYLMAAVNEVFQSYRLAPPLASGGAPTLRDTRYGTNALATWCNIGQQNTTPAVGQLIAIVGRALAQTVLPLPYPVVMVSGTGRAWSSNTDQRAIEGYFWGREFDLRQR